MRLARIAGAALVCILLLSSISCATPTYYLSSSVNGQGSVMPSSGDYLEDEAVILLANPASGWQFDHWEGAASGNDSLVTITMNSDKEVTAYFVETGASGSSSVDDKSFTINLPVGWEEFQRPYEVPGEGASYYSLSACSGSGAIMVVSDMDATGMSLQSSYEDSRIDSEYLTEGYNFISKEEITIDGIPAIKFVYTTFWYADSSYQSMDCVLVHENICWSIMFGCPAECWDSMESTFNTMLNSFKVLD